MPLTRIRSGGLLDAQVGTADIADSAITSAKLGATAITDKLGFTPANSTTAATLTGSQTLQNKTLGTGNILGADITGGDFVVTRTMLKDTGYKFYDSGATSALDYTNGSHQRWAPTGTVTLSVTNWAPTGNLSELMIEGINLVGATITWPTVNWIKSDGTMTTTFSSNGITLTSGTDFIVLWTRDAGTTVYGKVVR